MAKSDDRDPRPSATPPPSSSEPLSPIGVPPGYVVERDIPFGGSADQPNTRPGMEVIPPRYYEGDDWLPASLTPQRVADLQRAMIAAGLIDKDEKIRLGIWDEVSRAAYRRLLAFANASGLDASGALSRYQSTSLGATGGYEAPPLQVKLSNPDDLKAVFRKAVIDQLGEAWDETKLDQMVAAYQDKERQIQTEAYNMDVANEGQGMAGTVTPPPSPETFATTQIESEDPTGVDAHRGLTFQNAFFEMLGGVV